MRIAFIVGTPPKKLGSLEQWVLGVCAEALRRGHTVDLFTLLPVHPVVQQELDRLGVGFGSIESLRAAPVAAARRLASYDLIYANMLPPRSKVAFSCYAAWPASLVFVEHCGDMSMPVAPLRRYLSRALDQVTLLRVNELVGVSEYVRGRDVERFGLDVRCTRVIHNGVDPGRFTTEKTPNPSGALRMICVSQLIPEKGIDVLLRAMTLTRAQDCTLRVVGYGRMEEPYKALVRELGLEKRVEFLGMRDDVHLLLRDAEACVHTPILEEAFGLAVTEGMVSGCGVIATRSGGIPEIIDDGVNGLLVPKGDAAALASAIDTLAFDPALRARLGAEGRRKVERAFTLSRCISEHVDCMEQVASERRSAPVRLRPASEAAARPAFSVSTVPARQLGQPGVPADAVGPQA
ncbi:MAG TPA: glycosyltransferase family 4 protein [Archangium sp.]|nr:glycosyltransferase family 4 protein [Archangium sp.]